MSRTTVRGLSQRSAQRPSPPTPLCTNLTPPDARGETGTVSETDPAQPAAHTLGQSSMVCLPLVDSQNRKVVWVNSNDISQKLRLDDVTQLNEAFDRFPYLTQRETAALAQRCSLHLDQVRVWFIVQRLRYGISWECEDVREVWERLRASSLARGEEREDGDPTKDKAQSRRMGRESEEGKAKKRAKVGGREKATREWVKAEGDEEKSREEKRGKREGGGKKKDKELRGKGWKWEEEEGKVAAVKREKRKKENVMAKRRKKRRTKEGDGVREEGRKKRRDVAEMKERKAPNSEAAPVIGKGQRELSRVNCSIHSGPVAVVARTQLQKTIPTSKSSPGHRDPGSTMPLRVRLQRAQPVLWKSFQHSQRLARQELLRLRNETGLGMKAIQRWFAKSRLEAPCQTQSEKSETPVDGSTTYTVQST